MGRGIQIAQSLDIGEVLFTCILWIFPGLLRGADSGRAGHDGGVSQIS